MYGSSFKSDTETPRLLSSRPIDATVMPLPTDETTPPLTKMYRVTPPPSRMGPARIGPETRTKKGTGTPFGVPVRQLGRSNLAVMVTAPHMSVWRTGV